MHNFFKFLLCKLKTKKHTSIVFFEKKYTKQKKTYVFKKQKSSSNHKKNITICKKTYTFYKNKSL